MSPGMGNESIGKPTDQGEVPGTGTIQDPFEHLARGNDSVGESTVFENIEGVELYLENDHPGGDTGNIPSRPLVTEKRPAAIQFTGEILEEILTTDEVEMEEGELNAGEIIFPWPARLRRRGKKVSWTPSFGSPIMIPCELGPLPRTVFMEFLVLLRRD